MGGVAILMSFLYYIFQSILNTFHFGYFFGGKELIIFPDGGYPLPFAENSAQIINLILMEDYLRWKTTFNGRRPSMEHDPPWKMTFNGRHPRCKTEDNL